MIATPHKAPAHDATPNRTTILREKLERLVVGRNKSEACRSAGLPVSALDAMINKGRMPGAAKAVRIAQALGVSADWLFDDEQP